MLRLLFVCAACGTEVPTGTYAREVRGHEIEALAAPIDLDALPLVDVTSTRTQVLARQGYQRIPVEGTWFEITYEDPCLVELDYHLYESPRVDTEATLDAMAAIAVVDEALGVDAQDASLTIVPVDDGLALAWSVPPTFVLASGDRAGELLRP